jgi:hypothetical protein
MTVLEKGLRGLQQKIAPPTAEAGEQCLKCRVHKARVVAIPCGHLALCVTDADIITQSAKGSRASLICPACHKTAESFLRIYAV